MFSTYSLTCIIKRLRNSFQKTQSINLPNILNFLEKNSIHSYLDNNAKLHHFLGLFCMMLVMKNSNKDKKVFITLQKKVKKSRTANKGYKNYEKNSNRDDSVERSWSRYIIYKVSLFFFIITNLYLYFTIFITYQSL
ncbi:hypothetical protein EDEG_03837 [Edhazardia aedis USNM 41457]|uniref:Uncharacterized protein n=1 Tax=Edhazardia aedis (strain USNM 41457) TaxID=1003232 RepID=J9D1B5_EDHAE|nr:hypothetical protein EDEG_03837 [Edhazardia aedis USNM 41457]|eukprot:EJW01621.1 hypothetical protein EDEG_03837 [Edhazardia aedis USNM 41457]